MMDAVTVSPKFQVVIPKAIREQVGLKPGQKYQVYQSNNVIRLVPIVSLADAYGMFEGINTDFKREKTDRDVTPS